MNQSGNSYPAVAPITGVTGKVDKSIVITVDSVAMAKDLGQLMLFVVARGPQSSMFLPRDAKVIRMQNGSPVMLCPVQAMALQRKSSQVSAVLAFPLSFFTVAGEYQFVGATSDYSAAKLINVPHNKPFANLFVSAPPPPSLHWVRVPEQELAVVMTPAAGTSSWRAATSPRAGLVRRAATTQMLSNQRAPPTNSGVFTHQQQQRGGSVCVVCSGVADKNVGACVHRICRNCAKTILLDAIRHHNPIKGPSPPAKCPIPSCGRELSRSTARESLDATEFAAYDQMIDVVNKINESDAYGEVPPESHFNLRSPTAGYLEVQDDDDVVKHTNRPPISHAHTAPNLWSSQDYASIPPANNKNLSGSGHHDALPDAVELAAAAALSPRARGNTLRYNANTKIAVSPTANNYAELGVYSEAPQPIAPQPTPPVNSAYGEILSDSQIMRHRGGSLHQSSGGSAPAPMVPLDSSQQRYGTAPVVRGAPPSELVDTIDQYADDLPPPPPPPEDDEDDVTTLATSTTYYDDESNSDYGDAPTPVAPLDPRFLIKPEELIKGELLSSNKATGCVYKGTWRHSEVAIREVDNRTAKHTAEFHTTVRQLQRLRPHRNVVQLLGVCTQPPSIVCDYHSGGSLAAWLKKQSLPLADDVLVTLLCNIAAGINHLHLEGVVHRQLTARAVILALDARVAGGIVPKLSNFGMSRSAAAGVELATITPAAQTALKWLAPEQLGGDGQQYSSASDMWSFGVLCYEAATRTEPWAGIEPMQAAAAVMRGERLTLGPHAPSVVTQIATGCWNLDPKDRPTADDAHRTLSSAADALGVSQSQAAPVEQARPDDQGPPEINPNELMFDNQHDLIGQGTFGEVYKAVCRGQRVAVKVPKRQQLTEAQLAEFRHEVSIMRRIFHPNVVLFLGACTQPGSIRLVTELLPAGDLDGLLHSNRDLSLQRRFTFMLDTARAMNWLHGIANVVHRDLKPANLLIDNNMNVKVTDFGFSQLRPADVKLKDEQGPKGSALWMAPEVFTRQAFTEKIDVYAFGLIVWEILTRQWLFPEYTEMGEFRHAIVELKKRPPITRSMCGPPLARLMRACWHHNPDKRPSFVDVLDRLELARVEALLPMPGAAEFWFGAVGASDDAVDWAGMARALVVATNSTSTTVEVLRDHAVDVKDSHNRVTLDSFAALCNKFGAVYAPDHWSWMSKLLRSPMFHGAIERGEAQRRLAVDERSKPHPPGTYLVRMGKDEHPFTISLVTKAGFAHKRVGHVWGSNLWRVAVNDQTLEFPTVFALLSDRRVGLGQPAKPPSISPYDEPNSNPYEEC